MILNKRIVYTYTFYWEQELETELEDLGVSVQQIISDLVAWTCGRALVDYRKYVEPASLMTAIRVQCEFPDELELAQSLMEHGEPAGWQRTEQYHEEHG